MSAPGRPEGEFRQAQPEATPALPPIAWPPLILGARVSGWVRLRDGLLTLAAWGLLLWTMKHTLQLVADYLRPPVFQFSSLSPPNWVELWHRLDPFYNFIATLLLWLLLWALLRGRQLRLTEAVPQPVPLSLAAQAADFGLDEAGIAPWREARILVVHFDAAGQPSHGDVRLADHRS